MVNAPESTMKNREWWSAWDQPESFSEAPDDY
jgi:hypothetical protein